MEQHEPPSAGAAPDDAPTDATRLQDAEERAQRYLANWQRAQADLQNLRKQVERDQQETAQWAAAALMTHVLSSLDDFERAFATLPVTLHGLTWVEGVWLAARKLEAALAAQGMEPIAVEVGARFDPALHEAVAEVDGQAGQVVEVVQRGYTLGGRLLRPTLVTVGNGQRVAAESGASGAPNGGDAPAAPAADAEAASGGDDAPEAAPG